MRFSYDNSAANPRNPNHPPKRVRAGNQSTDEMAHLWLQVLPRGGHDLRLEIQEALMHHRLEKYPADFAAHFTLGGIRLARLDPSGAAAELEPAIRIEPQDPEARNLLGSAFLGLGRTADAIDQFRVAVRLRPDFQNARYNLARALIKTGDSTKRVDLFRQVVAAYPRDAQARNGLGEVLFRQGKFAEALAEFDKALAIDPSSTVAQTNRDLTLKRPPK